MKFLFLLLIIDLLSSKIYSKESSWVDWVSFTPRGEYGVLLKRANNSYEKGDYKSSINFSNQAIDLNDSYYEAYFLKAISFYKLNEYKKAYRFSLMSLLKTKDKGIYNESFHLKIDRN